VQERKEKRKWTVSPARAARYEAEREQVIRVAYRLMAADPLPISIQEILDATGLGTRAFYRHFASKDDLFLAMYRHDNERVARALTKATSAEPDPWQALLAWVELSLSVAYQPSRLRHSRVLGSVEVRQADGYKKELLDGNKRSRRSLEALLERGALEKVFTTDQVHDDALVIAAATSEFVSLRIGDGDEAPTEQQALEAVMSAARRLLNVQNARPRTSPRRARKPSSSSEPR
jgi:AcrR family transcriptional regulator